MTTIRYGDVRNDGSAQVTSMAAGPGYTPADGWQIVSRLPASALPAGTTRLGLFASFKVANIRRTGTQAPQRGVIQVALGTDTGSISPLHEVRIAASESVPDIDGLQQQIAMVQNFSPAIVDPFFGATWTNGTSPEICIWARCHWNGDAPNYSVTFAVADITWLWFDMDAIPAGDVLAERWSPATPQALTASITGLYRNLNTPGSAGQKWLHFHNVVYRPGPLAGIAPCFRFGYSPSAGSFTGFVTKVGTSRWGQCTTSLYQQSAPRLHQGCFWYAEQPAGVFSPGLMAFDRQTAVPTLVERYTYVGIRLDHLYDLLVRTEEVLPAAAASVLYQGTPPFTALERTASILSEPAIFGHGVVDTGGRQAFDCSVRTNRGDFPAQSDAFAQADATRLEGTSSFAIGRHGIPRGSPALQYRAYFRGGLSVPSHALLTVRDFLLLQVNLVRDPEIIGVEPVAPGNPIVITPGREGPSLGSLLALPVQPDAAHPEEASTPSSASIAGATGYRRGWPLFVAVRGQWALVWSRLRPEQADELFAFLAANPAFRWRPHREAELSVIQVSRPELDQVSGHVQSVQVRVAQLLWQGGS